MSHSPAGGGAAHLYGEAVTRAVGRSLPIGALVTVAGQLDQAGEKRAAAELYKVWIAYNADDPLLYVAAFNQAIMLAGAGDNAGAINTLRDCIRLRPGFYSPYVNLGRVLEEAGQTDAALAQWQALADRLALVDADAVSHKAIALQQMGRVLKSNSLNAAAEAALKAALDIDPSQVEVIQNWIALRQAQCKWPVLEGWDRVGREALAAAVHPLSLLNMADDPMAQLASAYHYNRTRVGGAKAPPRPYRHDPARPRESARLRLGYVSSDLRDHAVGFAMTDVFETHDRARFETFAYYCGIKRPDATQDRIRAGVDAWVDITDMGDEAAAARIHADGIDILIDLNGHTSGARTGLFALRPAPIIVNWFGFPCTMGSPYHHYLIADDTIVPPDAEMFYSETVVRLPCYQPNDRRRAVAARRPTRAEQGLPEGGVVFCCLNGLQKLTAATFRDWMAILAGVPGSVLWLLGAEAETAARLRALAETHGVAGERLVFAQRCDNADHLARYALADLFLDNQPYGAHTTAADAMWMGVPIVTRPGRSFAARVCASLVRAAGIGDLVCPDAAAYVARAVALGRDPQALAAVKARLAGARDTCLLFDTPRLVACLEELYRRMWADYEEGRLPRPDLANLAVVHEIAQTLDPDALEGLDDAAYRALYRDRLALCHQTYPLQRDGRLWREDP